MSPRPNKFTVGSSVSITGGKDWAIAPRGAYTITRVLPWDREGWQYHVQSFHDQLIRRVHENQLTAALGA